MKLTTVKKLVREYRAKMQLDDWNIDLEAVEPKSLTDGNGNNAFAVTYIDLGCKRARMRFDLASMGDDRDSAEIVGHEVAHIALTELGFDSVLHNAQEHGGFKVAYEVQERICDRIGRIVAS